MKILLDEQVPLPVIDPLVRLLPHHRIDHVQDIGWKSKKDLFLLRDLVRRGYEVLVTADVNQLEDPHEVALIKKGGFHHVRFQVNGRGVAMMASAIATIVAGLPAVIPRLEQVDGQRLVHLKLVKCGDTQYEMHDPTVDPPPYWPTRKTPRKSSSTKKIELPRQQVPSDAVNVAEARPAN